MTKSEQLNSLILLRNTLCGDKRILPYMVYTVGCAKEIVKSQPKTLQELGKVKGFPANGARIKNYGKVILEVLWSDKIITDFDIKETKDGIEINISKMNLF